MVRRSSRRKSTAAQQNGGGRGGRGSSGKAGGGRSSRKGGGSSHDTRDTRSTRSTRKSNRRGNDSGSEEEEDWTTKWTSGTVADEDDEEIDSDDVFTAEDYAKYGDVGGSSSSRKRKRANGASGYSSDGSGGRGGEADGIYASSSDSEAGGEFITLSEMFEQAQAAEAAESKRKTGSQPKAKRARRTSSSRGGDDSDENESEGDNDPTRLARVVNAIERLDGPGARTALMDRTETTGEEGEYGLDAGADIVSIADLVGTVKDDKAFAGLQANVKRLNNNKRAELDAPLPTRLSQKLMRQAAFDKTKEEIGRWQPVVKRNREAEKLNFPLNAPGRYKASTTTLVANFKPKSGLEAAVAAATVGTSTQEVQRGEALEMREVDPEEAKARHAALAKARALLFYEEKKNRRVKRIKSKTYRRIAKKSREKEKARALEAAIEADPELAREMAIKAEADRARERMTLRHKNKSSWARKAISKTAEGIAAQNSQHDLHYRLTAKANGEDYSSESDGGGDGPTTARQEDSESSDTDVELLDPEERRQRSLRKNIDQLERLTKDEGAQLPEKGLFSLKFMKRGFERKQAETRAAAAELLEQLNEELGDSDDAGSDSGSAAEDGSAPTTTASTNTRSKKKRRQSRGLLPDSNMLPEVGQSAGSKTRSSGPIDVDIGMGGGSRHATDGGSGSGSGSGSRSSSGSGSGAGSEDALPTRRSKRSKGSKGGKTATEDADATVSVNKTTSAELKKLSASSKRAAAPVEKTATTRVTRRSARQSKTNDNDDTSGGGSTEAGGEGEAEAAAATSTVSDEQNPWLSQASRRSHRSGKAEVHGAAAKELRALRQQEEREKRSTAGRSDGGGDDAVASGGGGDGGGGNLRSAKKKKAKEGAVLDPSATLGGGGGESGDEDESTFVLGQTAEQRKLVSMAFAGDDVVAEFEKEKQAIVDEAIGPAEPVAKPGWGSWTGMGTKPVRNRNRSRRQAKKAAEREARVKAVTQSRKDRNLKNVIINEKRDKKAAQYMGTSVPFPYKSAAQFEQSTRVPLGKEWNATAVHEKLVAPRVAVQRGTMIDPIKMKKPKKTGTATERRGLYAPKNAGNEL